MNLAEIAEKIKITKENIVLLYAFNATGKTRLSVAYTDYAKQIVTDKNGENRECHTGVYYNAYSEDLFVWENNVDNGENVDVRLNITYSSLNKHHSTLNEESILTKLAPYNPKYSFKLNPYEVNNEGSVEQRPDLGHGSISFYLEQDEKKAPIKISRGEERIFIWCFFLALMDIGSWTENQNEYIFIDDPVSSLDDHNIYITAQLLLNLMVANCDNKKIIITTHHMGIFSILQNWLGKGDNSPKFQKKVIKREEAVKGDSSVIEKTIEYEPKYLIRFLELDGGVCKLVGKKRGAHLYHLFLLKELKKAIVEHSITPYHFLYLRQILECVASFLGEGRFASVLEKIGVEKSRISSVADTINEISHSRVYSMKTSIVNPSNQTLLEEIYSKITTKIPFSL